MENMKSRIAISIFLLLLSVVWFMPNLLNTEKTWWPSKKKLNYGLDIQGGLHLAMGVDVTGVVSEGTTRLVNTLKSEFERDGIVVASVKASKPAEGEIEIQLGSADQAKVVKMFDDKYSTMLQKMSDQSGTLVYRYFDSYLNDYKNKVIHQAIETIRNRIDEFGVAEPSISQQGTDRIIVQLPGMADAEKAKQLINTTAKLDFMMVEEKNPAELQALIEEAEKVGGYNLQSLKYTAYVARLNKDLAG